MESADPARTPYVVPRYRDEGEPAWYHVLHGTVPGHQIDFMYCPHVPQARLTQTHFGHLARLIKYIEPRQGAPFAFALGNLSRDDIQHEPGHGGLALIFALRVAGVTDHAGRDMPPYAHGVLAIDRDLSYVALLEAITVFYRRFLDTDPSVEDATGSFYRAYVHTMEQQPEGVETFLHDYVTDFDELPQPQRSALGWDWEADEAALPKRVTIVHADDEPFTNIADATATLGAMLYKSNIKWTAITSGEIEIPGGISIRLVPASEAPRNPVGVVIPIGELPSDEAELAAALFGAKSREVAVKVARAGWREALGAQKVEDASAAVAAAGMARQPSTRPPPASTKPSVASAPPPAETPSPRAPHVDVAATIPMALEPVGDEAPFDARRSPPPKGAPAAFDARQSSPVKGVPAAAFDARQSPPATGAPAAFDARRSSPTTGVAAAVVKSVPPAVKPPADSAPPPSFSPSEDIRISEAPPPPRSRLGLWIGILGAVGVVAAIAVAMAGGSGEESTSGSGVSAPGTGTGTGMGTGTNQNTGNGTSMAPAPAATPSAAVSAAPSGGAGSTGAAAGKGAPNAATAGASPPATPGQNGGSTPTQPVSPGTAPVVTSPSTTTKTTPPPRPTATAGRKKPLDL